MSAADFEVASTFRTLPCLVFELPAAEALHVGRKNEFRRMNELGSWSGWRVDARVSSQECGSAGDLVHPSLKSFRRRSLVIRRSSFIRRSSSSLTTEADKPKTKADKPKAEAAHPS